jgi:RNA polymerase sigma factor (sigma-70 family)
VTAVSPRRASYGRRVQPASDSDVIVASIEDPERFTSIYERHHDMVFRFVARRVGTERAADLTAEVFLRAFRLRARFDPARTSARPWLYGIATNVIGDDLRKRRRQQRNYLVFAGLTVAHDNPYDRSDDRLAAAAVGDDLNRALGALRSVDRNVLLLYALEDLTYQETAEALGIPVGTVRSRLARARRRIRELVPDLEQRHTQQSDPQS